MTTATRKIDRSGVAPALWGVGSGVLALGIAVGVSLWQSGAQRQVLDADQARCGRGDTTACDALRSLCLKRYGDACEALAEAIFVLPADKRDTRDAMRLLGEACELRTRRACVSAGRKLLEGNGVAKDPAEAKRLLARGCELGEKDACALGNPSE
jgi:TPR repeat protein